MNVLFGEAPPERPRSFDVSAYGRIALLDRDGGRLRVSAPDEAPRRVRGVRGALRCRWVGGDLLLLEEQRLRILEPDGTVTRADPAREGARDIAVTREGSPLVVFGGRAVGRQGDVLERRGRRPASFCTTDLSEASCLAVAAGGVWIAGTGPAKPAARALYLRPTPEGYDLRRTVALPAPPRAAAVGPDGALYVVLEPGESMVRVWTNEAGRPVRLPAPLVELRRNDKEFWGLGPRGFVPLTQLVPRP